MIRYLKSFIQGDLKKKMVFIGGPRQVGKTTLAKDLIKPKEAYLNWDIARDRDKILNHELPNTNGMIFDEIHKYKKWRNFLKGVYDEFHDSKEILVTGSAKLDYYRRGGDSLQGRYFFYRLHQLSVAELKITDQKSFETLLRLGGFPEPFFSGKDIDAKRWSLDYRERLVREDLASLERVEDLGSIELLLSRLPKLVGSPLSINALREDLQVSHHTVRKWLDGLERIYAFFRVAPFGAPKIRSVKKERKHYHFDWTLVKDPGARFENLVACHLLKWCHFKRDTEGQELELMYFRDIDRREVDFIVVENKIPKLAVECKTNEKEISPSLNYFKEKFPHIRAVQVNQKNLYDFVGKNGIEVTPAIKFLSEFV